MPEEFIRGYEAIAYCARCRRDICRVSPWLMGKRFRCPASSPDSPHVAAVIQPDMRSWLHVQQGIVAIQTSRRNPRVFVFGDKTGTATLTLLAILLVALIATGTRFWPLAVGVALLAIADILLQTTSAVFITQLPRVVLRTLLLGLLGFVQLVTAFAVLHASAPAGSYAVSSICGGTLDAFTALYFSLVTMATLGYGDVAPCVGVSLGRMLVIVQVLVGLFFLSGLFATMASWGSGVPSIPTLEQLRREER